MAQTHYPQIDRARRYGSLHGLETGPHTTVYFDDIEVDEYGHWHLNLEGETVAKVLDFEEYPEEAEATLREIRADEQEVSA